jgi:VCBS repeat-containing protein
MKTYLLAGASSLLLAVSQFAVGAVTTEDFNAVPVTQQRTNNFQVNGFTFRTDIAVEFAILDRDEGFWLVQDGGPSDRALLINAYEESASEFSFRSTDGSHFKLDSFKIQSAWLGAHDVTVFVYRDGELVGSGAFDLWTPNSVNGISYEHQGTEPLEPSWPYGAFAFDSAYQDVDQVRIQFASGGVFLLDDIYVSTAVITDVAPTISSVNVPANSTYITGQNLSFTVNTSENVTVTGTPLLRLTVGTSERYASYSSGSGSSALVFSYTVQAGDHDEDGIVVAELETNASTLRDSAGNLLITTLNSVGSTAGILVDGIAPTIASVGVPANDTYRGGQTLDFTVNFNEPVAVNSSGGTPRLELTIGPTARYANYQSGSGTSALVFRYTVQDGDNDDDGIVVREIQTNGGTLRDSAGNNATLTLNSVGNTAGVLVDTMAPNVPSMPELSAGSDTGISGDNITADDTPTFTGTAEANSTVTVASNRNGSLGTTSADNGGNWTFTATPLSEGTHAITAISADNAGNTSLASPALVITVDTTSPAATSIFVTDTMLTTGETSVVTITFSEAVTGFTDADLTVSNGTLGAVSSADGGITWTATLTPAANVNAATNAITLDNTGVTDAAGNNGTGTTSSNNYAVNTTALTASIVVSDSELTAGEISPVTIAFDRTVTGFGNDDLTFANGTLSPVSSSDGGVTWTAILTPSPNSFVESAVITLNLAGVTDTYGNPGVGTSQSNSFTVRTAATNFVVTSASDAGADATIGASLADDVADGAGLSLREALSWIRSDDTITFDLDSVTPGYQGGTIVLNGSPLVVAYNNITIDGDLDDDGAADVTLDGNNISRVMAIAPGLLGIEIDGLTLTKGSTTDGGGGLHIGAGSTVTVRNSAIMNNATTYGGGGGVYGANAALTMINSTVSGNSSNATGGGISIVGAASTLTLINSTVSANATSVGADGQGGGVYFDSSGGILTLVNSTISGNRAVAIGTSGGGLRIANATAYIYNSTIVGNTASGAGGGVTMSATMSTLVNTVVAGNGVGGMPGMNGSPLATGGSASDVSGQITRAIHSYFGTDATIATNTGSLTDQGTNYLLLDPLAAAHGHVPTHKPRYGSALIDAGSDGDLPADTFDIDGDGNTTEPLPIDATGHRRISATVEIGAVEVNDPPRANNDNAVTNEDMAVEIDVLANDSDSDGSVNASTVTIESLPSHGSAAVNANGSITYTPAEDWSGADSFTYSVADNEGTYSEAATVSITITPVNDLPVISGTPATVVTSGTLYTFTPTVSDVDPYDSLTVNATNLPSWMTLDAGTGTISGTPGPGDAGTYSGIVLTVSDGIGTSSLPAFAIVVISSFDFDGDGMSDAFEELYGLDPRDPSDAAGDLDGDGVSNLDEYRDNRDPTADDYPPVLSSPVPIAIDAIGLLTPMPELSPPTAVDGRDGALTASLSGSRAYLEPGTHILTWHATDSAGNRGETLQAINVRPLISLTRDQITAEGATAHVRFVLNGMSPIYPLTVAYEVDGTADANDHDLVAGTVVFEAGELEKSIAVRIAADGVSEGEETIQVSLVGEGNFGAQRTHSIRVVEANVAPTFDWSITQSGRNVRIVTQDQGAVTLTATASDANAGDTLTYTWSLPPEIAATAISESVRRFDPAVVAPGTYRVELTVTDNGVPAQSTRRSESFQVLAAAPALSDGVDSDGDGIDDATEGMTDSDGDGQPDYLDANDSPNVLSESAGDGGKFLIEADPGVRLSLGRHALTHGADGAYLAAEEIAAESAIGPDTIHNVGGYFDLEIRDLQHIGASIDVVLPQREAIPQNPLYRKFINGRWTTFVENAANRLASAPGEQGVCPPPGSSEYRAGLNQGDWCVRLTLEDGGPNDADGIANGTVEDPGGVGTVHVVTSKTRGGGALGPWMLVPMLLLALHRLRETSAKRFGAIAMLALAVSLPTHARAEERSFYATATLGSADTQISKSDVELAFASLGIDSTVHSVDSERLAWGMGVGYRFSDRWSVEAGYLDLGEVDLEFDASAADTNLAQVHPLSAQGATISGSYRMRLSDRVTAHAQLGAYVWMSDYTTRTDGVKVDTDEDSGIDLLWGVGVGYALSSAWSLELRKIEFDDEPTQVIGLQAQWRIPRF